MRAPGRQPVPFIVMAGWLAISALGVIIWTIADQILPPESETGELLWRLYIIVSIGAAVPLIIAEHRSGRRWKRISRGLCPACGYDLRATPDCCPECGWVPDRHTRHQVESDGQEPQ